MAGFDIIDAAGKGYITVWRERGYLARLAAPVLLVKLLCLGALSILGLEHDYLRQSVVLLPAFFIEGWLVVHLVRLIVFGERWSDAPDPQAAQAGMLVFVLMKFALTGLAGLALGSEAGELAAAQEREGGPMPLFAALAFLALAVWSFRYLWLYIPAGAGVSMRAFLRAIGGFGASLSFIGVWLICFVPFILALGMATGIVLAPFDVTGSRLPVPAAALLLAVQAVLDTATTLVATAAMTHAIRAIAEGGGRE